MGRGGIFITVAPLVNSFCPILPQSIRIAQRCAHKVEGPVGTICEDVRDPLGPRGSPVQRTDVLTHQAQSCQMG